MDRSASELNMDAPTMPGLPGGLAQRHGVSFREAFWTWARVAALSFGGSAGQIAVMHRILVEEKRWIGEARFLHALNYCMLLPGPEAHKLAVYIGWLLHKTRGGIVAGTLFVLPGLLALSALSLIYVSFGSVGFVQGVFFGLKAAVLAIEEPGADRHCRGCICFSVFLRRSVSHGDHRRGRTGPDRTSLKSGMVQRKNRP